jgi:multiple sugar transport system ATP-binding protein
MAKVAFNNVSKRFDVEILALKQFNLNIEHGEFMVLVGPSGCGKSTALRLLAGLESVSEGEILIDDRVVNQITPQQRNIAMVFQNYALYPHMTVRDNLAFPLKMAHSPTRAKQQKIIHITELLDLGELLDRKPKQLSGGQRQRVAMGRALVRDPSVFLLDEPLSNLDARLRAQIRADIAQLQSRLNKTTLYVTHDQVEAMTLGDRVAVMNQGELQQVGTPEDLYNHPHNIFVAGFVGSPGMNIIPARMTNTDDQLTIQLGQQNLRLPSFHPQVARQVSQDSDKKVFVGIRPEAFHISPINHGIDLVVRVSSVEYLGHESLVYFHLSQRDEPESKQTWVARIPGRFHLVAPTEYKLYIDPMSIYLFNRHGVQCDRP